MISGGAVVYELVYPAPPERVWRALTEPGSTVVTFELSAVADGTLLRMEHGGWTDTAAAARDQFDSGWHAKLGSGLRSVLDGLGAASQDQG